MTALGLLKAMLLPPVGLLLLVLAGLLLALRWPRPGWLLSLLGTALLLVLAMPITGALMLAGLSSELPRQPDPNDLPAAIVILSAEARALDRNHTRFEPGPLTWERLLAGARLARAARLPILVSGGPIGDHAPTLAGVMAVSLAQYFNLPPRWQEAQSRDTWENARFSADILKESGVSSVYLVSHGWHLRRATVAFRHFGLRVTAVAAYPNPWPAWRMEDFVPSLSGLQATSYGLHEWLGGLYYGLRE